MSLRDCIARDIDNVFLNTKEFCDNLTIQIGNAKFNVIGSLQSNSVQNNSGNGQPLQEDAWVLYIRYPMTNNLERTLMSTGTRVLIAAAGSKEFKSYSVTGASDELGLATIQLSTKVGR